MGSGLTRNAAASYTPHEDVKSSEIKFPLTGKRKIFRCGSLRITADRPFELIIYTSTVQDICAVSFPVQRRLMDPLALSLSLYLWTWLKAIDIRHGRKGTDEKGITRSIRTKCSCKPVYFFFSSITGYGLTSTTSVQQHMWWVCGWIRKNIRFFFSLHSIKKC